MNRKNSSIRLHILEVAAQMIALSGSQEFRIADVATRANVGVPTIYYHFDSRSQLIAEAQVSNYFAMAEPLHQVLSRVELAVDARDEVAFWAAVQENMSMAWSSGQIDSRLGIMKLILDVWGDPKSQRHFCDLLDVQFARWVAVVDSAKKLGWIEQQIDATTLTAVIWSATVGQVITAGSSFLELSPLKVGDFFMRMIRGGA